MNWQKAIIDTKTFNINWIQRNADFINNNTFIKIADDYVRSAIKSKFDIGFNLFTLISNTYHQENFHSDILKIFLTNNSHDEGNNYLMLFLNYLNSLGAKINLSHYNNPEIEREKGRIDLLIYDKVSKRAIIIENKINNAADMHRQLPRYVEYVQLNRNLLCDCIVYISLNKTKLPVTNDWKKEEAEFIKSKIVYSLAYSNSQKDLYNGWILKAEKITNNIDALLVLRQYGALLKKLGGNIMNKVIVEKFYEEMLNADSFKTAQSIKSMLADLILFRAERILEYFKFRLEPFANILVWQSFVVALHEYYTDGHNWSLDIGVYDDEYRFEFWDRNNGKDAIEAKQLLQKMNVCDNTFYENNARMKKRFSFPNQEQELLEYVIDFKIKLIEVTTMEK